MNTVSSWPTSQKVEVVDGSDTIEVVVDDMTEVDEDNVTETTAMLEDNQEQEIIIDEAMSKDTSFIRPREAMSRIEYWARGGLQESCGKNG